MKNKICRGYAAKEQKEVALLHDRANKLEALVTSMAIDQRRMADALEKYLGSQAPVVFTTVIDHVYIAGEDGFCVECGGNAQIHLQGVKLDR